MDYRFMFLRTDSGFPVACVAMKYSKAGMVTYGVSTQHPKDRFNRKLARDLALGRLVSSPWIAVVLGQNPSAHDISRAVVSDLLKKAVLPSRTYSAAKKWLKKVPKKEV